MDTAPYGLAHAPIISADNYRKIDGPYAYHTDAIALSFGLAQWDKNHHKNEVSLKVWRYKSQWSRQSEELPPHRALDLSVLLLATILKKETNDFNTEYLDLTIKRPSEMKTLFQYIDINRGVLEEKILELHALSSIYLKKRGII